jgi:hypothetical protein
MLMLLTATRLLAAEPAPQQPVEVKLVGRIVCVACELKLRYDAPNDCATSGHRFGFLAEDGDLFTLLETDRTRPLIKGEKYAYQLVQIQGRRYPHSMVLEVREVAPAPPGAAKSAGQKVYYCATCAITTYMPGPCPCCGEPVAEVKK